MTNWIGLHASLMLGCLIVASIVDVSLTIVGITATVSFALLTFLTRRQWTASGRYGLANSITAARLGLVYLMLGRLSDGWAAFMLAMLVLLLDGVDGWQARRSHSCSAYGDLFDKEVDAFFTLSLCLVLYRTEQFGLWILLPGALRYVYSLCERGLSRRSSSPASPPLKASWTRAAGAFTIGSLTACLLPLGSIAPAIAAAATIVVTVSFFWSFRTLPGE